ncbi:MAG: hypothetical protein HUU15_18720, partial [Candidatus Brocadiae bacterium]|nr:hypothetical protein [Candidatus Brocadiia bacterium]
MTRAGFCAAWALIAAAATADGVRPRTTEDLGPIERARREVDADRHIEAATRLAALLDEAENSDLAVGRVEVTPTVRGWKALIRETAAAWAAESDRFAEAWETEAEVRV